MDQKEKTTTSASGNHNLPAVGELEMIKYFDKRFGEKVLWFGAVNLSAIVAGFLYIAFVLPDKAAELAIKKADSQIKVLTEEIAELRATAKMARTVSDEQFKRTDDLKKSADTLEMEIASAKEVFSFLGDETKREQMRGFLKDLENTKPLSELTDGLKKLDESLAGRLTKLEASLTEVTKKTDKFRLELPGPELCVDELRIGKEPGFFAINGNSLLWYESGKSNATKEIYKHNP